MRDAFARLGHDAWSCDLLPSDSPGNHYQCDVRNVLTQNWDMIIAFPPCTFLCSSGMHWTVRGKRDPKLTEDALEFARCLLGAPAQHIALENPVGAISTRIRKPDCIIQPWQFGHPESKTTCLWLKNLPPLIPTNILKKPASGRWLNQCASGQNKLGPAKTDGRKEAKHIRESPTRWQNNGARSYCLRLRLHRMPRLRRTFLCGLPTTLRRLRLRRPQQRRRTWIQSHRRKRETLWNS